MDYSNCLARLRFLKASGGHAQWALPIAHSRSYVCVTHVSGIQTLDGHTCVSICLYVLLVCPCVCQFVCLSVCCLCACVCVPILCVFVSVLCLCWLTLGRSQEAPAKTTQHDQQGPLHNRLHSAADYTWQQTTLHTLNNRLNYTWQQTTLCSRRLGATILSLLQLVALSSASNI